MGNLGIRIVFLSLFALAFAVSVTAQPTLGRVEIRDRQIGVEIADTPEKVILGLSRRERLPDNQGMLFIYEDRAPRTFWMKEMQFDLDIIWIDAERIVQIDRFAKAEGAFPSRTYRSRVPVNRVLEVNAGLSDRWGLQVGDRVRFTWK